MMLTLDNQLSRLALVLSVPILINAVVVSEASTQEVDLGTLCQKFPQNSRCENYESASEAEETTISVDRDTLCSKFPQNSYCQKEPPQILKLQLERDGEDDEWVRLEKDGNRVKLSHATSAENGLISGLIDGALSFVPVPLPFVNIRVSEWKDHQTMRVAFQPDSCSDNSATSRSDRLNSSCTITGVSTLVLPEGTDIYAGLFRIEYQEGELLRAVTFRIPPDADIEQITTVTFSISSESMQAQQERIRLGLNPQ